MTLPPMPLASAVPSAKPISRLVSSTSVRPIAAFAIAVAVLLPSTTLVPTLLAFDFFFSSHGFFFSSSVASLQSRTL